MFRSKARIKFIAIFLTIVLFCNFFLAAPAKAQITVVNPLTQLQDIGQTLWESLGGVLASGVSSALSFFIEKLAKDTAVWLASGDYDKGPAFVENPSEYFKEAGAQAGGEFIAGMSDNPKFGAMLKSYGMDNLCVPPDLNFQLLIKLNLMKEQNPTPSRCDLRDVGRAYTQLGTKDYWKRTGVAFSPGKNELSNFMELGNAVDEIKLQAKEKAKEDTGTGGKGADKAPQGAVSGDATTPTAVVKEEAAAKAPSKASEKNEKKAETTASLLREGHFAGAAGSVANLFISTLANTFMQKLMNGGLFNIDTLLGLFSGSKGAPGSSKLHSGESQAVSRRELAEAAFADFISVNLSEVDQYQYTAELGSKCDVNPSPFCEAMDKDINDILGQSLISSKTVGEALKEGKLHGDWKLIPPGLPCESNAYCYANLVKLRQFRILPIGWEIAAKLSPPDQPDILNIIIKGFYNPQSNYFHLIDPNWLLKAPLAKCGAMVYGKQFLSEPTDESPGTRAKYCADIQHCIKENNKGGCEGWGYCLQERNVWDLGGDSCPAQFNTCAVFNNNQGAPFSFLSNTIDRGVCDADNAGCRAFSRAYAYNNSLEQWQWQAVAPTYDSSLSYFNKKTEQCNQKDEGCSRFVRAAAGVEGEELYIDKAPSYYNCYGENLWPALGSNPTAQQLSSSTLQWPANKADLFKVFSLWNNLKGNKEICAKFANVCTPEEVGCELYIPQNNTSPVPGVLSQNDLCPKECAGYETYVEQPLGKFASASLNYFIPATARACSSQYTGCAEFVNLEAQEAGGETKEFYTDIRLCSKDPNEGDVYYTWEGSDTAGYQLKSFNLKKAAPGYSLTYQQTFGDTGSQGPLYNTADLTKLAELSQKCSAELYALRNDPFVYGAPRPDPDCREFYDKDGNKYYRLYSATITVSAENCRILRKSEADQNSCAVWGGAWANGVCTFLAIPTEGVACPVEMNGCRAYKGNAGNNFQTIYTQDFESGTIGSPAQNAFGWQGNISAESISVGGKSLKASGSTGVEFNSQKNSVFVLYFWAKGEKTTLNVDLKYKPLPNSSYINLSTQAIKLTSDWLPYSVGPLTANWLENLETASTTISFNGGAGKIFFLDNVAGKMMADNIYVVKNSWKTPSSCDNLLSDPFGASQGGSSADPYRLVPQAQLGCENYTTRSNAAVAVKSFTNLCRAEAVGCEEMIDTFNSNTTSTIWTNLLCELNNASTSNLAISCKDKTAVERCSVLPGQKSCRFDYTGELQFDNSGNATLLTNGSATDGKNKYVVTIKKDTKTLETKADRKIYMVNDKKNYCAEDNLGCSAFGPVKYEDKATGARVAATIETIYLKNQPENYKKIMCTAEAEGCEEYNLPSGGQSYFKDPGLTNKFCEYNEGVDISELPGRAGVVSGWFKKDVGVCVDPAWTFLSSNLTYCAKDEDCVDSKKCLGKGKLACREESINGKSYGAYTFIPKRRDLLKYEGFVGLCPAEQNGCTEFVDTTGAKTPENQLGQPYYVVNNEKLDRTTCAGKASLEKGCILLNQTDKATLSWSANSTYEESRLNDFELVSAKNCGTVSNPPLPDGCSGANDTNIILKVKRDRVCDKWLACRSTRVFDKGAGKETCSDMGVCEKFQNSQSMIGRCAKWDDNAAEYLTSGQLSNPQPGKASYADRDVAFTGRDYSGYSWPDAWQINALKVEGSKLVGGNTEISESCRGYPSAEVPPKQGDDSSSKDEETANSCSYTKVKYSGKNGTPQTKFYNYNEPLSGTGVCDGGYDEELNPKMGEPCWRNSDCEDNRPQISQNTVPEDGICLSNKKVSRLAGWNGYCLFEDPILKTCVQWYPIITPPNSISPDDLNMTAGYVPPEGSGRYWCTQAKGNMKLSSINDVGFMPGGILSSGNEEWFRPTGAHASWGGNVDKDCTDLAESMIDSEEGNENYEKYAKVYKTCLAKCSILPGDAKEKENCNWDCRNSAMVKPLNGCAWRDSWTNYIITPNYTLNYSDLAAVSFQFLNAFHINFSDIKYDDPSGGKELIDKETRHSNLTGWPWMHVACQVALTRACGLGNDSNPSNDHICSKTLPWSLNGCHMAVNSADLAFSSVPPENVENPACEPDPDKYVQAKDSDGKLLYFVKEDGTDDLTNPVKVPGLEDDGEGNMRPIVKDRKACEESKVNKEDNAETSSYDEAAKFCPSTYGRNGYEQTWLCSRNADISNYGADNNTIKINVGGLTYSKSKGKVLNPMYGGSCVDCTIYNTEIPKTGTAAVTTDQTPQGKSVRINENTGELDPKSEYRAIIFDWVWSSNEKSGWTYDNLTKIKCKEIDELKKPDVSENILAMRIIFNSSGKLAKVVTKNCAKKETGKDFCYWLGPWEKWPGLSNDDWSDWKDWAGNAVDAAKKAFEFAFGHEECYPAPPRGVSGDLSFLYKSSVLATRVDAPFWLDGSAQLSEHEFSLNEIENKNNFYFSEIAAVGLLIKENKVSAPDPDKEPKAAFIKPGSEIMLFPDQKLWGVETAVVDNETDKAARYWSGPLGLTSEVSNDKELFVLDAIWSSTLSATALPFQTSDYDNLTDQRCKELKLAGANAFAIRMLFDSNTGKFLKYKTKECSGKGDENTKTKMQIRTDVRFYLKEVCLAIEKTVKTDSSSVFGFSAKARTDRLWSESRYLVGADLRKKDVKGGLVQIFNQPFDQFNSPFGAFSRGEDPETMATPQPDGDDNVKNIVDFFTSIKSVFRKIEKAKKIGFWPIWVAPGGASPLSAARATGRMCVGGARSGLICGGSVDCPERKYKNSLGENIVEYGICSGVVTESSDNASNSVPEHEPTSASGTARLGELFVQSFGDWNWYAKQTGYGKDPATDNIDRSAGYNYSAIINPSANVIPHPPEIHSLDNIGAMTINGNSNDKVLGQGSFLTTLNFYAWADHDQMPIVRVAIDWDDDTPVNVTRGWFKNHKPECKPTQWDKVSQKYVSCSDPKIFKPDSITSRDEEISLAYYKKESCRVRFGDSSGACQADFFTFRHVYSCRKNGPGWNAYGAKDACAFKPKVQVLDNWGWCNGTCATANLPPGVSGCWNDQKEAKGNFVSEELRGCYFNKNEPWTEFGSTIEVKL